MTLDGRGIAILTQRKETTLRPPLLPQMLCREVDLILVPARDHTHKDPQLAIRFGGAENK
jgi:hypothetical protein